MFDISIFQEMLDNISTIRLFGKVSNFHGKNTVNFIHSLKIYVNFFLCVQCQSKAE